MYFACVLLTSDGKLGKWTSFFCAVCDRCSVSCFTVLTACCSELDCCVLSGLSVGLTCPIASCPFSRVSTAELCLACTVLGCCSVFSFNGADVQHVWPLEALCMPNPWLYFVDHVNFVKFLIFFFVPHQETTTYHTMLLCILCFIFISADVVFQCNFKLYFPSGL